MSFFKSRVNFGAGVSFTVTSTDGDYSVSIDDCIVEGDATNLNIVLTLPLASSNEGLLLILKKIDSSVNTVTISAQSPATIDGDATKILTGQYDALQIISDGTNWLVINSNAGAPIGAGISGYSGYSGTSGYSGDNPGSSGYSGYSGISGYSGDNPGSSGYSGYSGLGFSGYSGYSGKSGYSGYSGPGFIYRGVWADSTIYYINDIVTNDGNSFVCYQSHESTGILEPPVGVGAWIDFWEYLAASGYSGYSGRSGYSGYSGPSGYSGYSGPSGYSGYSGPSGYSGYSGIGISGYSGYEGMFGGDSQPYNWTTNTGGADAGQIGVNNATYSSATQIWVDIYNSNSALVSGWLTSWDDNNTSPYSIVKITGRYDASKYVSYRVTEVFATWDPGVNNEWGLNVEYISHNGTFTNGEKVIVSVSRIGYSGYSGVGVSGTSGRSGYSGYSGKSGYSGYSGVSGFSGDNPGSSGYSGYSGQDGVIGSDGISGYSGYLGLSGYSGYSGTGSSGYSGYSGISGYSGDNPGSSGYSGYSGATGGNNDITKEFTYDIDGKLSTITDANGTKTFNYDIDGILTSITGTGVYPDKTFIYDGNGKLTDIIVS